tara:strand:- start:715 stop:1848 length:1134 start_codon:yes stop_codon:yes gene_type:complete
MNRLGRYIFSQTFLLTILVTAILSTAVWLMQSLRFIDYVMTKGISFLIFFKLSSFLLPTLVSTILPVAFLIAILFIFSKLYSDSELVVMRSLGLSNLQIMKAPLVTALLFLSILYAINLYIQPLAHTEFKDLREDIRHSLTGKWLQPATFTAIEGITFYTKRKTRSGDMKGIFVYDARDPKNVAAITAEVGQIVETPKGLRFILYRGTRQVIDSKTRKPSILNFEQYSVDVETNKNTDPRHKKANELSMAELFHPDGDLSDKDKKLIRVEVHERILLPLMLFPFALLAGLAFLLGDYNRRGRSKRIIVAVFSCLILEVSLFSILNISSKYEYLIEGAYGLVILVVLVSFKLLIWPPKPIKPSTVTSEDLLDSLKESP